MIATGKKGQNAFQNMIIIIVFMSVFAIFIPIGLLILQNINAGVQEVDDVPDNFKAELNNFEARYPLIWDGMFIFMIVLLFVGTFIFSFLTDSQPLLFGIFAIALALFIFVIPFLANAFEAVVSEEVIATANSEFVIIPFVMAHYVGISVSVVFVIGIAFFAKRVLI